MYSSVKRLTNERWIHLILDKKMLPCGHLLRPGWHLSSRHWRAKSCKRRAHCLQIPATARKTSRIQPSFSLFLSLRNVNPLSIPSAWRLSLNRTRSFYWVWLIKKGQINFCSFYWSYDSSSLNSQKSVYSDNGGGAASSSFFHFHFFPQASWAASMNRNMRKIVTMTMMMKMMVMKKMTMAIYIMVKCVYVCLSRFCLFSLRPKFSLPTIHLGPAGQRPAWA